MGLGHTRPLLNDGVLQYKKKWGYGIKGTYGLCCYIALMSQNEAVTSFLVNNPFIHRTGRRFEGAVFQPDRDRKDHAERQRMLSRYAFAGLQDVRWFDLPNDYAVIQARRQGRLSSTAELHVRLSKSLNPTALQTRSERKHTRHSVDRSFAGPQRTGPL